MNNFTEITPYEINDNLFKVLGKDWGVVTAEKNGKINTMTVAWGGFGVMWNKNVAYIVIRPQRYTKEFVDHSESFSLAFFDGKYKKELGHLGTVSGRDEDKIATCNFSTLFDENVPYFEQAELVLFCKKLYLTEFKPDDFLDKDIMKANYPDEDYHILYIAEITKVLKK